MVEQKKYVDYQTIISSNSPWIKYPNRNLNTQKYHREAYFEVRREMFSQHGMAVLIKGPRRVGKTEIQRQLISELISSHGVDAKRILYLTFDDVQILSEKPELRVKMVQGILDEWAKIIGYGTFDEIEGQAYCFFDEVQSVSDWAYLVKNRVERNKNVRIILSGSAAHSIFEKALKILMGRVISVSISTFSFREYLQKGGFIADDLLGKLKDIQTDFERSLDPIALHRDLMSVTQGINSTLFRSYISQFLADGGFPQLWGIDREGIERAQFVDENYVRKVTVEDLALLKKINKPDLYERLLRHLFARPGQEYNQNKVSGEIGTTSVTLSEAMQLLEQTELLIFVERFSSKAEPIRKRNVKIYPIDMMLTSAMTKIVPSLDLTIDKGVIAESLAAQTIKRWKNMSRLAFMYSEDQRNPGEIDFYIRSDMHDCPIEVKYQSQLKKEDTLMMRRVIANKSLKGGIIVTPDDWSVDGGVYAIPLWAFMMIS